MKQRLIIMGTGALLLLAVVFVAVFFLLTGNLKVEFSQTSEKEGAHFTLSNDKYQKEYSVPSEVKLRRGTYQLYAVGDGTTAFRQELTITPGQTTVITVALEKNPSNILTDSNPDLSSIKVPVYLSLFPHYDAYFEINAKTEYRDNKLVMTSLTVIPYVVGTSGETVADLRTRQQQYVTQAKEWLRSQNVPEDIPVIVEGPY